MRDQLGAEHRLGVLPDFVEGLRELDAAGLAAAARVHLGFDDPKLATELFSGRFGLGFGGGDPPLRNRYAVLGE
jgi:hypothetical protein